MQITSRQKKYVFFSLAGIGTLIVLLLFTKESGLFRANLLSDADTVYNNPLEVSYKPQEPSYSLDMNRLSTSSYQKEYTPTTLGTTVHVATHETASGTLLGGALLGMKNLRISFSDTDPLSEAISTKMSSVKNIFLQQLKNVFPALNRESPSLLESTLQSLTVEEFLKNTASGTLFTPVPGTISIVLNTSYAYDPFNETVEHVTGPVLQTAGSGTLIMNDVSTHLSKVKNIPLIAERNRQSVLKVKQVLQEELMKKGYSSSEALEKTNLLLAKHIFFELGYQVSTPEHGYLDPVTYGKVVIASIVKMKEIVPEVHVSIDVPGTYAISAENRENGEWWNWGKKKNVKDLFQSISRDPSYNSIKNNIKGITFALPTYTHWKESLHAVRSIADMNGFSHLPLRLSTSEKDELSSKNWNSVLSQMKSLVELSGRKDVADIHILNLFSELIGININGYWLREYPEERDLYLATLQNNTIRTLPLGVLLSTFQNTFTSSENFSLRLLRSTETFTEFFGISSDGKKKGMVLNMAEETKVYRLKNTDHVYITEVKNMTTTGSLVQQFHGNEIYNVKAKEAFIVGINGHPMSQESYKQTPVQTSTEGVPIIEQLEYLKHMGFSSYRVDVAAPDSTFDVLVNEAKKRNISILPVIFPPLNLDAESDLEKIEKISYEYALEFASKYKNDIPVWELHNEMDNYTQLRKGDVVNGEVWPYEAWMIDGNTKEQHEEKRSAKVAAMMHGLTEGIRKADSKLKTTINGGWLHYGYIQRLVDAGVNFDILSWHWYSSMGDISKVKGSINLITELSKFGKDIWITEGNTHGGDMGRTGDAQAQYVKDVLLQMKNFPEVKAYYFYELLDEPYFGEENPESHYGFYHMKKSELGTWIVDKAKLAVAEAKKTVQQIRTQELLEKPLFTQGIVSKEVLTEGYTGALRSEVFPSVHSYSVEANPEKVILLELPPKSILFISEKKEGVFLEKLLLESVSFIKEKASNILPQYEDQPRKTPTTPSPSNINTNEVNLSTNVNMNVNNTSQNENSNLPIQKENTPLGGAPSNQNIVSLSPSAPPYPSYQGVGGSSTITRVEEPLRSSATSPQKSKFTDISKHFAEKEILFLEERGIIQGRTSQKFVPEGTLNRAESVKLLLKAFYPLWDEELFLKNFRSEHPTYTYFHFKDVPISTWFSSFVGKAKELGVIQGTGIGNFEPARNITRAEFIKIVLELQKIDKKTLSAEFSKESSTFYRDVPTKVWFREYVYAAAQLNLIEKRALFEPNRSITRGEAAKIVYKALLQSKEVK